MKQESVIRRPPPLHSKPARIVLSPVKPKSWQSDDIPRPVPPLPLNRVMPTCGPTNRNSKRSSSSSPTASSSSASSMRSDKSTGRGKGLIGVYTPKKSPKKGRTPSSVPTLAKISGPPLPAPPAPSSCAAGGRSSSTKRSPTSSLSSSAVVTRSSFAFSIVQKPPSSAVTTSSSVVAVGVSPSRSRRRRPSPSSRVMTLGRRGPSGMRGSGSRFSGSRRTSVQTSASRLSIFKSVPKPLWLQSVQSEEETDLEEEPRRKRTDCQPLLIPVATTKTAIPNGAATEPNGMTCSTPSRSAGRRSKQIAPAVQLRPARRATVTGVSPASSLKGKPPRRASIAAASNVMNASGDRPLRLAGSPRQTRSIPSLVGLNRRAPGSDGYPPVRGEGAAMVSSPRRGSVLSSQLSQPSGLTARLSDASTSDKTFRAANSARSNGGGLVLLTRKGLSPPQAPPPSIAPVSQHAAQHERSVRRIKSSRPVGEPSILDRVASTAKMLPDPRRRPERRNSKPLGSQKLIESRRCRQPTPNAA
eukprot:Protomagalhaensia_sp_Gyna_25__4433@NODE_404_length_3552_cov_53_040137_g310_i0_p1_GENE_NODE_404_length_3552_cov_53_040137_g310_i0NODE_404_length_3552_cov_53_040137_g310_i0_p1_ORF_typecomplete_len528_score59_11_NODE_404_length_3552_cov_53_040137_g310_i01611744